MVCTTGGVEEVFLLVIKAGVNTHQLLSLQDQGISLKV